MKTGSQPIRFSHSPSIYPSANKKQIEEVGRLFDWNRFHSRPRPTKTGKVLQASTPESGDCGEKRTGPGDHTRGSLDEMSMTTGGQNEHCGEEVVMEILISVDSELTICLKQKVEGSAVKRCPKSSGSTVGMGGGSGGSGRVKGGGNKEEMGMERGDAKGKGVKGSVEGKGEKGDSDEFDFDEWPLTASFDEAVGCAVDELLTKSPAKGEKIEGIKTRKQIEVGGSGSNGVQGGKGGKRGREEDTSDCKD